MHARVNGTKLYFDVEGASLRRHGATLADKLTLVALHGAGFDHAYLRPPLSPLTETAQIVYLDHRGQGRSGATEVDTWTVEHTADDVAGLSQVLGIRRPFILDHSFGVFVALAVALRYSYLCGKLILANTGPRIDLDEALTILEGRHGAEAREIASAVLVKGISRRRWSSATWASLYLPTRARQRLRLSVTWQPAGRIRVYRRTSSAICGNGTICAAGSPKSVRRH